MDEARMSLKHQVTLFFAGTLVILMSITALAVRHVAELTVRADITERLDDAAADTREALAREIGRRGYLTLTNAAAVVRSALSSHAGVTHLDLTYWIGNQARGFALTLTPSGPLYRELDLRRKIRVPEGTLRREYWLKAGLGVTVRLGLGASLVEADRLADKLSRIFIMAAGSGLILLVGTIYALAHRFVSAPLDELWQLTRQVARGELEGAPASRLLRRNDEIGVLARSFQEMMAALKKARDENQRLLLRSQRFNRELETRIKEATTALADKNQALIDARQEVARHERLAALGQLAGNIAHELGTPLSTLSGYLQLTLADPGLTEDQRSALQIAANEAERMTRIIRRFLDSTRGLKPAPEPVDLEHLFTNVVELVQPPGTARPLSTRFEIAPEARTWVTDPGLLRQVLINLTTNARDASGRQGTITFRAGRAGDRLLIEVEDEGPGVPEDKREAIFEPFYTTKQAGRGTGLGLAISREIARALKGTLEAGTARSGTGARFTLTLPALEAPAASEQV